MLSKSIEAQYGYLQQVHTVTRKMIEALPEDKLDFKPVPELRTFREIVMHIYGAHKSALHGVKTGKLTEPEQRDAESVTHAPTKAALIAYADGVMAELAKEIPTLTEEQLVNNVDVFYGKFPGHLMLRFMYDEHWHHRGQLYVYLRLLGIEPPFLYGYPEMPS